MSPLNLLAVTHYPPMAGGSSRSCGLLWPGIARRGHRVVALGPITPETRDFDQRPPDGTPAQLTVARYELPYFHMTPYDPASYLRFQVIEQDAVRVALPGLIDRHRPEVLISAHETLGEAIVDAARAKGIPCALMLRGTPTWQIVTGQYPEDQARVYLDLYRRFDIVIAVGDYMRAGLAERGVGNVIHIPNFLDLGRFSPGPRDAALAARYGIAEDDVVVLHPSVMNSRKRPEDILRSAAITLPLAPKLVYVFVGGEQRGRELEEMARREGWSGRMRFIEKVPYEQMPDHIRMADIVAVASAGEGVARVYLEAQASGRVLISSDIPAGREVVDHGRTGLLFRTGDVDDLAAQILRAYGDVELRRSLGAAARAAMANHAIERVIDQYAATFDRLRSSGSVTP